MDHDHVLPHAEPAPDVLTLERMMQLFQVGPMAVRAWVKSAQLPAPFYLGKKPYWSRKAILAFLDERMAQAQPQTPEARRDDPA